jgi:hypothetical protein
LLLVALALLVYAAACIAEFLAASALHVIAALWFLHPDIAEGALLVLGAADELFEGFLILVRAFLLLVLGAWLAVVPSGTTLKTIVLLAFRTVEMIGIPLWIVDKCVVAISWRAPRDVPLLRECMFKRVV